MMIEWYTARHWRDVEKLRTAYYSARNLGESGLAATLRTTVERLTGQPFDKVTG